MLRIGTRSSKLALKQVELFLTSLDKHEIDEYEVVKMSTTGDKIRGNLALFGGKGLFTKELDQALLDMDVDVTVNSLKDIPAFLPEGIEIMAMLEREDPADAFLSSKHSSFDSIPPGGVVGTSSVRRAAMIKSINPSLTVKQLRGNIDSRIARLHEFDGILLSYAGILRLGLQDCVREVLSHDRFLPAVGQGTICIIGRAGDAHATKVAEKINHLDTWHRCTAEREIVKYIDGDCHTEVAALASIHGDKLDIKALLFKDGEISYAEASGDISEASEVGRLAAKSIA